jgi:hypothetical protein
MRHVSGNHEMREDQVVTHAKGGMPRPLRATVTLLAAALIFFGGGMFITEGLARLRGDRPENRFALYALRTQVSSGMTEEELRRLLARDKSGKIEHRWLGDTSVSAWTQLSFWNAATLSINLQEGRVVHAAIRNGEDHRLEDAPPDF